MLDVGTVLPVGAVFPLFPPRPTLRGCGFAAIFDSVKGKSQKCKEYGIFDPTKYWGFFWFAAEGSDSTSMSRKFDVAGLTQQEVDTSRTLHGNDKHRWLLCRHRPSTLPTFASHLSFDYSLVIHDMPMDMI
jgi:hypothetical protein